MAGRMEHADLMKTPQPAHHPRRSVLLELPLKQHEKVAAMAKERGLSIAVFALNLFNAAYSARSAPTGDAALDRAVSQIDAPIETMTITKADRDALAFERNDLLLEVGSATSEADALRKEVVTLEAQLKFTSEQSDRFGELANTLAGKCAELEEAMKGAAVISDHAGAIIRERDDEIAALKEALSTRVRELLAARSDLIASAEQASRWQAMSESLGAQLQAALIAKEEAACRAAPGLTSAQVRMARALRAAGNSNPEIARAFGVPVAVIEPLFRKAA